MPRKQPFPPEADTQPDIQRPSGPAPKSKRARAEAPTVPPPKSKRGKPAETAAGHASHAGKGGDTKNSGIRSRRPPSAAKPSKRADADGRGASVDEVTADLSKDPRRERDE